MKSILVLLLTSLMTLSAWGAETVDINVASAEEIADTLTGIGPSTAQKIVVYRDQNGAFEHIDQLINVKGVGMKTVDKNRDRIVLSNSGGDTQP